MTVLLPLDSNPSRFPCLQFTSVDTEDMWGDGGGPSTITIKEDTLAGPKPQPAKRNITLKNGSNSTHDFASSEA